MECWDRSRCQPNRLLPTLYHPVFLLLCTAPHPHACRVAWGYSQPGAWLAGLLVPQGRLTEPWLPRPSLCLCAEGSMTLWKPLLSLERGTQLPPHHALPRPPALWHPANARDVGYLTHTHTLTDRVGADRLDQRRRQRAPQGLTGMRVWESLRQDTREGKNKERMDWEPERRSKDSDCHLSRWMERSRKGTEKPRTARPGATAGVKASAGCHGSQGPMGRPSPQSQMTFASSQRGEGEGTSGSIGGRG